MEVSIRISESGSTVSSKSTDIGVNGLRSLRSSLRSPENCIPGCLDVSMGLIGTTKDRLDIFVLEYQVEAVSKKG